MTVFQEKGWVSDVLMFISNLPGYELKPSVLMVHLAGLGVLSGLTLFMWL